MSHTMYITVGEQLALQRRRAGLTVAEMAAGRGTTVAVWRTLERGTATPATSILMHDAPSPKTVVLTLGEYCWLARRRKGWTLPRLRRAVRSRWSRMTLWKQEHDLTSSAYDMALWWRRNYPPPLYGQPLVKVALPTHLPS